MGLWVEVSEFLRIIGDWFSESSGWIIGVASAAIGAIAGSWSTQIAIERRERLLSGRAELRAVNRAILVCFSVVNAYVALKKQHLVKLVSDYEQCHREIKKAIELEAYPIEISADLSSLPYPRAPANRLEDLVFGEVAVGGRAMAAVSALVDAQNHLRAALEVRDALAEEFRVSQFEGGELAEVYLALPKGNGTVDGRYRDSISAISDYTDDCIFFAMVAAHDLRAYGELLIRRHKGKIGSARKHLNEISWSASADAALLPKASEYEGWTKGFLEERKWWHLWRARRPEPLPF